MNGQELLQFLLSNAGITNQGQTYIIEKGGGGGVIHTQIITYQADTKKLQVSYTLHEKLKLGSLLRH